MEADGMGFTQGGALRRVLGPSVALAASCGLSWWQWDRITAHPVTSALIAAVINRLTVNILRINRPCLTIDRTIGLEILLADGSVAFSIR